MEDDDLIGIISDRDVLKEISPHVNTLAEDTRALKSLKKKAHQIMTRQPITVKTNSLVEDAARILLNERISCLPVVSPSGSVEGILSWKDILKYFIKQMNAQPETSNE